MGIAGWFAATLRHYPEIAMFLTLALGYYFGKPALGYTVTSAVGKTLLTIWGMV